LLFFVTLLAAIRRMVLFGEFATLIYIKAPLPHLAVATLDEAKSMAGDAKQ